MYCLYSQRYARYIKENGDLSDIPIIIEASPGVMGKISQNLAIKMQDEIKLYKVECKYVAEFMGDIEKQLEKIAECLPPKMSKWAIKKILEEQSEYSYDYEDLLQHFQDMVDELKVVFS